MAPATQDFIDYLTCEKRVSVHTAAAYRTDLEQFFAYMKDRLAISSLQDIGSGDIRSWVISIIDDENLSARSANRKMCAVRAFYKYAIRTGLAEHNPATAVITPRYRAKLPEYIAEKDMETLFAADIFPDTFEGLRDRTVIELFYATGIRLSELANIRRQDIDLYTDTVKVSGKRDKERIIPFGSRMHALMDGYLKLFEREHAQGNENYYIFVAANGKHIYPKAVYRIVKRYLDTVTTVSRRSPHTIRHTFATHLLNNGADIYAIKEILGHTSLAATQIYTHNSVEQLKSIYKQAHPRA